MDGLLVVAGAFLAFLASYGLLRLQSRSEVRARLYLDLLPELRRRAQHYFDTANQDPGGGIWFIGDSDWPMQNEADAIYRHAMLAGTKNARHGRAIRDAWIDFARRIDPDMGSPSEQIIGDRNVVELTRKALVAIDEYDAYLERRGTPPWRK